MGAATHFRPGGPAGLPIAGRRGKALSGPHHETLDRESRRARGAGTLCRAVEHRLHLDQARLDRRRAADLADTAHGDHHLPAAGHCRHHPPGMAEGQPDLPQCRGRSPRARGLSRRRDAGDRPVDSGGAFGADPRPAADPDLDPRQPLSRRTRHAAAMGRAGAGVGRGGAGAARPLADRAGGMGLGGLDRVSDRHHARHALPEAVFRQHRLAHRQHRAIRGRGHRLRHRSAAVRDPGDPLAHPVHSRGLLGDAGVVGGVDFTFLLADSPLRCHRGGEPVLPDARRHLRVRFRAVRRTARCDRDRRHGAVRDRRRGGESRGAAVTAAPRRKNAGPNRVNSE